jgi:uncharacterized protein YjgD (DUF1641 family)
MDILNNNDDDFSEFLRVSQHIKQNLEQFMQNPIIKNLVDNSEDIINKYSEIWPELDYHEVISCYIALIFIYYKLF